MPPKASSLKRKAKAQQEEEEEEEAEHEDVVAEEESEETTKKRSSRTTSTTKKAKTAAKEPTTPLDKGIPTNLTFPIDVKFPPKPEGHLRLSNWNVCGINSAVKKGFDFYIKAEDPDIIILTETKVDKEIDHKDIKDRWQYRYWGTDPAKKGQAGVAILSKIKPLNVVMGLPTLDEKTTQGRCITLEFDQHFLVGTYTPNAGEKLKNIEYKKEWNVAFERYLRELDAKKPVIWGGDFNVAPTDKDIRKAKENWNKTPGYTQDEIDGYNSQLNPSPDSGCEPLLDVWREQHPDAVGQYSYYSYRFKCREKGIGWRLDSWILSKRIADKATKCEIRHECYGASDHLPVVMDFKGTL